ncbi:hypothetical protein J6590_107867 [Homalodisca vitripennis]|nr:hypothetical protein J6590_107867 [Homalodisca vitripennis]
MARVNVVQVNDLSSRVGCSWRPRGDDLPNILAQSMYVSNLLRVFTTTKTVLQLNKILAATNMLAVIILRGSENDIRNIVTPKAPRRSQPLLYLKMPYLTLDEEELRTTDEEDCATVKLSPKRCSKLANLATSMTEDCSKLFFAFETVSFENLELLRVIVHRIYKQLDEIGVCMHRPVEDTAFPLIDWYMNKNAPVYWGQFIRPIPPVTKFVIRYAPYPDIYRHFCCGSLDEVYNWMFHNVYMLHDDKCSVCIGDMDVPRQAVVRMPCNHEFHRECLLSWFRTKQLLCPYCKTPAWLRFEKMRGKKRPDEPGYITPPTYQELQTMVTTTRRRTTVTSPTESATPPHVPGTAGGGDDDDCDESYRVRLRPIPEIQRHARSREEIIYDGFVCSSVIQYSLTQPYNWVWLTLPHVLS